MERLLQKNHKTRQNECEVRVKGTSVSIDLRVTSVRHELMERVDGPRGNQLGVVNRPAGHQLAPQNDGKSSGTLKIHS